MTYVYMGLSAFRIISSSSPVPCVLHARASCSPDAVVPLVGHPHLGDNSGFLPENLVSITAQQSAVLP